MGRRFKFALGAAAVRPHPSCRPVSAGARAQSAREAMRMPIAFRRLPRDSELGARPGHSSLAPVERTEDSATEPDSALKPLRRSASGSRLTSGAGYALALKAIGSGSVARATSSSRLRRSHSAGTRLGLGRRGLGGLVPDQALRGGSEASAASASESSRANASDSSAKGEDEAERSAGARAVAPPPPFAIAPPRRPSTSTDSMKKARAQT